MWPLLLLDPSVSTDSAWGLHGSTSPASTGFFSPGHRLLLREGRVFWAVSWGDGRPVGSHAGGPFYLIHLSEPSKPPEYSSKAFQHRLLVGCRLTLCLSFKDQFSSMLGLAPQGLAKCSVLNQEGETSVNIVFTQPCIPPLPGPTPTPPCLLPYMFPCSSQCIPARPVAFFVSYVLQ